MSEEQSRHPVSCGATDAAPANILPFRSRADVLLRRGLQARGRWVRTTRPEFNPSGPEARQWAQDDAAERLADRRWTKRHGAVEGGAVVTDFNSYGKGSR